MSQRCQTWFVVDYYNMSSSSKMENLLMNWARDKWLNCSVNETSLEDMVKALKVKQGHFLEQNKRLKPVPITLDGFYRYSPDDIHRHLRVGSCYFSLQLIRKEIEHIDLLSV